MPNVLIKFGLTENGAGLLRCPHHGCGSDKLKLVMVAYTNGQATTVTTPGMTKVTWREPAEVGSTTLDVVYQCRNGHQFGVEMTYKTDPEDVTMGAVAYQTTWDTDDE
jgi:hypothetical protein